MSHRAAPSPLNRIERGPTRIPYRKIHRENPRGNFRRSENACDAASRLCSLRIAEEICVAQHRCQILPLQLTLALLSLLPFSFFLSLFASSSPILSFLLFLSLYIFPLYTLEFYFYFLCSVYLSFSITIIVFLLSCACLTPPSSLVFCHMHIRTHTLCPVLLLR